MIDGPDLKLMSAKPSGLQRMIAAFAIAALLVPSTGAASRAADRIGSTEIAKNIVQELTGAATKPIAPNDSVFANESVRTGADSAAKFVFSDSTNLAIGPTSTVKLDKFVYNSDTDYKKAAINLTAGAFRFTTGGSEKKAYEIRTNTATIGVRGTVLDVLALQLESKITLIEGACVICALKKFSGDPRTLTKKQLKKYDCLELTQPNQTARVTSHGVESSSSPVNFAANFCGGGGLCDASVATASNNTPLMCFMKQN